MKLIHYILICCLLVLGCSKDEHVGQCSTGCNSEWPSNNAVVGPKIVDVVLTPILQQKISIRGTSSTNVNLTDYEIDVYSTQGQYSLNGILNGNMTIVFDPQILGFQIDTIADTLKLRHISTMEIISTWQH